MLNQIFEEQYHVDEGCYYGLFIDSNPDKPDYFEIAWNVGLDNSSDNRVYQICYTVKDAVKIYNDCTEFYWQFLSTENGISGENITGTIYLPDGIKDIEKLRVWAHGSLYGEIQKKDSSTVVFNLPSISSNTMLEVRVVTEENIFESCTNIDYKDMLNTILSEEQIWADKANRDREAAENLSNFLKVVNGVILAFFAWKSIRHIGQGIKEKDDNKINIDYFRDIPDEKNATPARAAYLYYFKNNKSNMDKHISKIFSASILNLTLKGVLDLEVEEKNNIKIKINEKPEDFPEEEKMVYFLLKKSASGGETTTKKFEKYCKNYYEDAYTNMNKFRKYAEDYMKQNQIFDEEKQEIRKKWDSRKNRYWMLFAILLFISPIIMFVPAILASVIDFIICCKYSKKVNILTEKGNEQKAEWEGLKKYMEEFSLLKDKQTPDLVLWEKYLVYATVFGISKKVIEQLKVVYPEMLKESTYDSHYRYMYLNCNPMCGFNFVDDLEKSFNKTYGLVESTRIANTSYSSGSRRRRRILWRRRRWPEVAGSCGGR